MTLQNKIKVIKKKTASIGRDKDRIEKMKQNEIKQ